MNCFVFYVVVDGVWGVGHLLRCLGKWAAPQGLAQGLRGRHRASPVSARAASPPCRPALRMRMSHGAELFNQHQRSHAISTTP